MTDVHKQQRRYRKNVRNRVRIISGKYKSRIIEISPILDLRPTMCIVRETLFNWLRDDIDNSVCMDCYSGSGALGFESISRGAKRCYFVEKDKKVYTKILENIKKLEIEEHRAIPINTRFPLSDEYFSIIDNHIDIVFFDPPFRINVINTDLNWIRDQRWCGKNTLIYIGIPSDRDQVLSDEWNVLKDKKHGHNRSLLIRKN